MQTYYLASSNYCCIGSMLLSLRSCQFLSLLYHVVLSVSMFNCLLHEIFVILPLSCILWCFMLTGIFFRTDGTVGSPLLLAARLTCSWSHFQISVLSQNLPWSLLFTELILSPSNLDVSLHLIFITSELLTFITGRRELYCFVLFINHLQGIYNLINKLFITLYKGRLNVKCYWYFLYSLLVHNHEQHLSHHME